uniref:Apolipoprotein N-acyltransferase n=1 Tax=candidate division WOR-3 bacterium TaxID=2052148 RepID=A0A7V3ZXP5_UNCW3
MQRLFLVLLSFILYLLSFPPFKLYPFAFFSLVPLFLAIKDLKKSHILLLGLVFFYPFWFYHTHWILNMEVEPETKPWLVGGLIILPAYLSIFNIVPLLGIKNKHRVLLIPSLWVIFEYLRSSFYTGFPWVNIAYSQLENPYFRMLNSIGGIYFTGFFVVLFSTLLFQFWDTAKKVYLYLFIALIISCHIVGATLYYREENPENSTKILIFQPNILPREENDISEWLEVEKSYGRLLKELKDTFDLVILPESALPGYFRYSIKARNIIDSLSRITNAPVLLGSADVYINGKRKVYNTAFLVNEDSIIGQYNKIHLVPFGEWLPYENKIKFLQKLEFGQGDFSPGDSIVLLFIKGIPFGTLICFESIFPYISRHYTLKGAGFLVNITSDGWYGKSLGPKEHFELLRFRAIESGKYIARSAKTGISAIIDPKGRVVTSLGLFEWGYISAKIGIFYKKTLYAKFGDFIIIISLMTTCLALILSKRRKVKDG